MLTQRKSASGSEHGLTLIELIVSIGLLGVILSTLSLVMLGSVRVNDETRERLDETRDEQFVAAYFATDVAGATEITSGGTARCGTGTALVEIQGTSYNTSVPPQETTTFATYVFTTSTVDGVVKGALARRVCEAVPGSATFPWIPSRSDSLATELAATSPIVTTPPTPTPRVTCFTDGTPEACSAATSTISVLFDRLSGGDPFVLYGTRRTTS